MDLCIFLDTFYELAGLTYLESQFPMNPDPKVEVLFLFLWTNLIRLPLSLAVQ